MSWYWIGPYDVHVDNEITSVVAADGVSTLYKDGQETEMDSDVYMNEHIYRNLYAEQNAFGEWYYSPNKKQGYWIGPYGVYVPNHTTRVIAEDGCNFLSKDGCITEMCSTIVMNEQLYKEKYTTMSGGDYYYKSPIVNAN